MTSTASLTSRKMPQVFGRSGRTHAACGLVSATILLLLAIPAFAQPTGQTNQSISRRIVPPLQTTTNIPILIPSTNIASDPLMSLMLSQPRLELSEPVVAVSSFDPPIIRPGEPATYRVVLNALEDSISWRDTIPAPDEISLRPAGRGQVLQLTGPVMQPRTTFNYRVKATELGRLSIPQFRITVNGKGVVVPEASIEVHPSPPSSIPRAQLLGFEPAMTNVFVGQSVPVRVMLPGSAGGLVQAMSQVQVVGKGIITDQTVSRQRIETLVQNSRNVPAYIYETMITAIGAGEVPVFAQGYAIGNRSGTFFSPAGASFGVSSFQYTLLDSDPLTLKVRPLPTEGRLPGFTGAIGVFNFDKPRLDKSVIRVGDPLKLTVTLRGEGNLPRVVPPPPPRLKEWQVFSAPIDNLPMQVLQAQGFAHFHFILIPMIRNNATPTIPFSYFDPYKERYVDLSVGPLPVTVQPGRVPADPAAIARAAQLEKTPQEDAPRLSGIATVPGLKASSLVPSQQRWWFPLAQAAPVGFFVGLWAWDRRRRFLEKHPEIVRRRRARRALRRLRRRIRGAAKTGDKEAFASAAVDALRVACAPHYPAEPRALVCSDILAVLTERERDGMPGKVVRRVFETTDAVRFADRREGQTNLLELESDLEIVLDEFQAKLAPHAEESTQPEVRQGHDLNPTTVGSTAVALLLLVQIAGAANTASAASPNTAFEAGTEAYRAGNYSNSAGLFREVAVTNPSSGALQNLGNSEWQRNRKGHAILAWEQALWLDPFNKDVRQNLQFARKIAHLESPNLAWFEVISSWLPINSWAWLAGASLWLTVGLVVLPGIMRVHKASWHQALAAVSLAVFLLSLPAHIGVNTRSRIGFVLQHDTPLRLTPTKEAQFVTRLAAGEPARVLRAHGDFVLVRASRTQGWVHRHQFGRITSAS